MLQLWLCLVFFCVLDKDYVERLTFGQWVSGLNGQYGQLRVSNLNFLGQLRYINLFFVVYVYGGTGFVNRIDICDFIFIFDLWINLFLCNSIIKFCFVYSRFVIIMTTGRFRLLFCVVIVGICVSIVIDFFICLGINVFIRDRYIFYVQ